MNTKNVENITIKIETKNGKVIEKTNPPALILSYLDDTVLEMAKNKSGKGINLGGIHFSGKEMDIMFCFHLLILNLIKVFGEKPIIKTLRLVFAKQIDASLSKVKFEAKVEQMRRDKKSNELPN